MNNILLAVTSAPIDYTTIIVTFISTIGIGGLGKLIKIYVDYRKSNKEASGADSLAFRKSLQDRVIELEDKVDLLQAKIEEMIQMYSEKIIALSTEKASLQTKLEILLDENTKLLKEIAKLTS